MLVNDVAGADVAELCRLFSRWSCLDVSSDFGKQPGIQEDDKPTQGVEDNKNVLKRYSVMCSMFLWQSLLTVWGSLEDRTGMKPMMKPAPRVKVRATIFLILAKYCSALATFLKCRFYRIFYLLCFMFTYFILLFLLAIIIALMFANMLPAMITPTNPR